MPLRGWREAAAGEEREPGGGSPAPKGMLWAKCRLQAASDCALQARDMSGWFLSVVGSFWEILSIAVMSPNTGGR